MIPLVFCPPPNTFRDGFDDALHHRGSVGEDYDVKEKESARDDLASSKRLLRCIFALLCNVFDAGVGAVMVVVKLMQSSEVSSKT